MDLYLTRRKVLKWAGLGVGVMAAACQPAQVVVQTVEVEKVVEKEKVVTVEVERVIEKEVTRVVEGAKAAQVGVTGTFWVLQGKDYMPDMNAWLRQAIVDYCAEKGWPLDISYIAGYTAGTPTVEKLAASVAAGNPADLINGPPSIVQLRQLYTVQPVSDIVEALEAQWGQTAARNKNDLYIDDQWWAVPYFQRSDGGWFQRPVFEEAGVDIHSIRQYPDLWDTLLSVSDPKENLYGWGVTINRCGDADWFRNRVYHGWGAYVQDESGQFVTFDSPQMVEAMTAMTDIYIDDKWADMLPPGLLSWTDGSNNEAYLAGRLAYTQNGGTVFAKARIDNNPIRDITGFHVPCGGPVNQEFNSLSSKTWAILRGAKNSDAARQLILDFMMSVDMMDGIFSNAPAFALPAYEDLWDASEYIKTDQTAQEQRVVAMDPAGVIPRQYPGPAGSAALDAANQAGIESDMVGEILRGEPVAAAVKLAHERIVKVFKEFGLPGEK